MAGNATAHAASMCNSDFRGDTVCISAAGRQITATGKYNPNATVFLTIYNDATGRIVAGPVGDNSLQISVPPGRYYANWFVQSNSTSAIGCQVDSPTVTI